jgi:hypothetical protein
MANDAAAAAGQLTALAGRLTNHDERRTACRQRLIQNCALTTT